MNDINEVADDLLPLQKVILFTWVSTFILLNLQQRQKDLKTSGDIENNLESTLLLTRPYWGH